MAGWGAICLSRLGRLLGDRTLHTKNDLNEKQFILIIFITNLYALNYIAGKLYIGNIFIQLFLTYRKLDVNIDM